MNTAKSPEENKRQSEQAQIDSAKGHQERNRLGQFATPWPIADQMLAYAATLQDSPEIRFLDPALGTGVFYSALRQHFNPETISVATGYEIDQQCAAVANGIWSRTGLYVKVQDFTQASPLVDQPRFNLVICNPPYVRHHHIQAGQKDILRRRLRQYGHMELNGLAGLYGYFMGLTHPHMDDGALAGWLIPSEFMDVNYGQGIRDYLCRHVTLHHIHRFDPEDSQFYDALVSSAIVWFTKNQPPRNHTVRMTFGNSLAKPAMEQHVALDLLRQDPKWTKYPGTTKPIDPHATVLSQLFDVRRGVATGNNGYFIIPEANVQQLALPMWALKPILPGPRNLDLTHIQAREDGTPDIPHRLFLLDSEMDGETIRQSSPSLARYLDSGHEQGVPNRYLCAKRHPWYSQEQRTAAPFLSTYLGRHRKGDPRPFRFIMNDSCAIAHNVYLMLYPKGPLKEGIENDANLKLETWQALNRIDPLHMIQEGRVYGGGLRKLEPSELGKLPVQDIAELLL